MDRWGKLLLGAGMALLLGHSGLLFAAGEDSADDDVGTDTPLVPRPSVMAPRAASALLLDIAKAGTNWVAVGQRGDILLSSDGIKWTQVAAPNDAVLTRVRFVDPQHGWAVGYDGTVLVTDDGGATWRLSQFDAAWGKSWYDVLFFDPSNGLLAGANGALKRTDDGGKTWTDVTSDVLQDQPNLYNLIPLGDGSLLMAGERGFLARSKDKGATWKQLKSPYTGSYFGALAVGPKGAVVFGLRGNAFYAADIGAAAELTAKELAAIRAAANDPEAATKAAIPVSDVHGWTDMKSAEVESLFGGTVTTDGRVLLVGTNGHIMQADLAAGTLKRLEIGSDLNMNAGIADGDSLIVVGTAGVRRLPLAN